MLILPADTHFVIDFFHLHTCTHMPTSTRRCISKWSGKDHLCVTQRTKDAKCQVSGVLFDVTSMFLDRSFVPFRIQQQLQGGALLQSLAYSILGRVATHCLFSSWDKDDRSGGCRLHQQYRLFSKPFVLLFLLVLAPPHFCSVCLYASLHISVTNVSSWNF